MEVTDTPSSRSIYFSPRFWLTVVIMVVIGVLLIKSVGLETLIMNVISVWPWGVAAVFTVYTIVMLIRTYRWKVLLSTNGVQVSFSLLAKVAWMAWAQNGVLPARLGEASRLVILKSYGVGYSKNTIAIALEKFFDLIGLVSVVGLMSGLIAFYHLDVTEVKGLRTTLYVLLGLIFTGFCLLFLVFRYSEFFISTLERTSFTRKFAPLLKDVSSSISHLSQNKWQFLLLLLLSILQWLTESLTILAVALILGVPNQPVFILFAAVIGYATYILPVTPGSFGPFEFFVGQILMFLIGIPSPLALSVPIVSHILVVLYLALTGILSSISLPPRMENNGNLEK
ncbi:MAG: UPF0104 family protein [Methanobacteriota archaeon]|nr:MAG: UPF0104 family protein [Euryarchaeota archaeon]